jgi:alkanesulfonate monooxygenase SsuD/methylene tetrahydromethanopterin reductase-like flavin-dependent oxidoreductase (luciferase family)
MEFGFGYFPTFDGMRPGEVARMAEQRGYSAIYFAEHTHIPAACRRRWESIQSRIPYPRFTRHGPTITHGAEMFGRAQL